MNKLSRLSVLLIVFSASFLLLIVAYALAFANPALALPMWLLIVMIVLQVAICGVTVYQIISSKKDKKAEENKVQDKPAETPAN